MILVAAIAAGGMIVSLAIRRHAELKLSEKEGLFRRYGDELEQMATEHQRLSNLVAEANSSHLTVGDSTAELSKLRAEAEALRKQTNELGKQLSEEHRSGPLQTALIPDNGTNNTVARYVVSDSNSEEYKIQLYKIASAAPHAFPLTNDRTMHDARNLASAIGKYAREHQGEFPLNFDQSAPYFYKHEETPRTSEFDLLFQGSLNELSNVPPQAVATVRERRAWPTPTGKSARVYVMATGSIRVVESDDNFQSWEAEHIIPAPTARQ